MRQGEALDGDGQSPKFDLLEGADDGGWVAGVKRVKGFQRPVIQGNRDLFMNIVGWLSQQENLISIRPNESSDRRLTMTSAAQANITWLALIIIPGFIFGTGVYAWWRRR